MEAATHLQNVDIDHQELTALLLQVYLTWNMARNIRVSDQELYVAMKTTLMRSIRQSVLVKQYALENDIPIRFHGHGPNEPVNYCMVCEEEASPYNYHGSSLILFLLGLQPVLCERE